MKQIYIFQSLDCKFIANCIITNNVKEHHLKFWFEQLSELEGIYLELKLQEFKYYYKLLKK